jgi:cell division protein FtsN
MPHQKPVVEPAASSQRFAEALRRSRDDAKPDREERLEIETGVVPTPGAPPARREPQRQEPQAGAPRAPRPHAATRPLPPRLRAKMEAQADMPRERSRLPLRLMIALALLAVVLVGATLVQRFLLQPSSAPVEQAGATPNEDVPPDAADAADEPADQARATASGSEAPDPEPTRRTIPPPPPQPVTTFVLNVGTYLNEDRAKREHTRLDAVSDVDAVITTVNEGSGPMYRVQIGRYASRAEAERAASDLIARGLVDEARILSVNTPAR